jgi:serine/threonine protein kinase
VALKMILAGTHGGPEKQERFYREARAAASLTHPNLVPVYEFGWQEGHLFFTMEFIDGPNLLELVRRGPVSAVKAAMLTRGVADGLAFVHGKDILHRDLKPQNILIDPQGRPRIMDFGLACFLGQSDPLQESDHGLTKDGQMLGTPGYMAPEQVQGKNISKATDIHGLGAVLYYLLAGRPPFSGDSLFSILESHLHDAPRPPSSINPSVPKDLEAICMSCLAKKPDERPSAAALVDALDAWLGANAGQATPWDTLKIAASHGPTKPASSGDLGSWNSHAQPQPQRRWWPILAGLLAVAVLAGIIGFLVRPSGHGKGEESKQEDQVIAGNGNGDTNPAQKPTGNPVSGTTDKPQGPVLIPPPVEPRNAAVFPTSSQRQDFPMVVELFDYRDGHLTPCLSLWGLRILRERECVLRVTCSQKASVGIFSFNSQGKSCQLFPNGVETNDCFEEKASREIPAGPFRNNRVYAIKLRPSTGVEQLRVLATTQPWPELKGQKDGLFMAFQAEALKEPFRDMSLDMNGSFAEVVVPFYVAKPK